MKKLKTKTKMLRRNGPAIKSVESVLKLEGSLWLERFVKEVVLEPGVKERPTVLIHLLHVPEANNLVTVILINYRSL